MQYRLELCHFSMYDASKVLNILSYQHIGKVCHFFVYGVEGERKENNRNIGDSRKKGWLILFLKKTLNWWTVIRLIFYCNSNIEDVKTQYQVAKAYCKVNQIINIIFLIDTINFVISTSSRYCCNYFNWLCGDFYFFIKGLFNRSNISKTTNPLFNLASNIESTKKISRKKPIILTILCF